MFEILLTGSLVALAALAAWLDLRTRRIPNLLTVGGLVAALVLRSFLGIEAQVDGWQGAGLALLVAVPFFALGAVGGGDAKLLVMAGAFLGPQQLPAALLVTALAGGALALVEVARRRAGYRVLQNTLGLVGYGLSLGRRGAPVTVASPDAVTVPYGVAIAVGSIVGCFL